MRRQLISTLILVLLPACASSPDFPEPSRTLQSGKKSSPAAPAANPRSSSDDDESHVAASVARIEPPQGCSDPRANEKFRLGFRLQKERKSQEAIRAYEACLLAQPGCAECMYEIGWAYWSLEDWAKTVRFWEQLHRLSPAHPGLAEFLPTAREKADEQTGKKKKKRLRHPKIGLASKSENGSKLALRLFARFQAYNPNPAQARDFYTTDIDSPKSARFSQDGGRVYVNSLEAAKTVIYATQNFAKLGEIKHEFSEENAPLFQEKTLYEYAYEKSASDKPFDPNVFIGKPVESADSHGGKYLWIPYYRRDFDQRGVAPSAVAIVDTRTDQIARVMATGPISKYALASPDGKLMAISHWGDNTLALIDISSPDPALFRYKAHLVVEEPLSLVDIGDTNRDHDCGYCIRGLAYSPDSRYLFVARMGGPGGIAVFDLQGTGGPSYLGTVFGMKPKPRDIHVTRSGDWLYVSSTLSGFVSRIKLTKVLEALAASPGSRVKLQGTEFESVFVGSGPRSIRLSPDERFLFAAVNGKSELVGVDLSTMKVAARIAADPYPVGLAISPNGRQIWVTSQGHSGLGGDSVMVYRVKYPPKPRKKAVRKKTAKKPKRR